MRKNQNRKPSINLLGERVLLMPNGNLAVPNRRGRGGILVDQAGFFIRRAYRAELSPNFGIEKTIEKALYVRYPRRQVEYHRYIPKWEELDELLDFHYFERDGQMLRIDKRDFQMKHYGWPYRTIIHYPIDCSDIAFCQYVRQEDQAGDLVVYCNLEDVPSAYRIKYNRDFCEDFFRPHLQSTAIRRKVLQIRLYFEDSSNLYYKTKSTKYVGGKTVWNADEQKWVSVKSQLLNSPDKGFYLAYQNQTKND